ncbi:aconitate hydratase AcnA [Ureibacillus sp. MALMAid1270]|uniref:aconitate hydratase AcnA n=1 Tax=Ureibacillus sp. MALMAid1270 TaxID=3411629 RepID=UPI003BA6716F
MNNLLSTQNDLTNLVESHGITIHSLPYSIRMLIENIDRNRSHQAVEEHQISALINWQETQHKQIETPFFPKRIVLQDYTGIPLLVDLATYKSSKQLEQIEPAVPVDLVIDHSLNIQFTGSSNAFEQNLALEYEQNAERYSFIKWAQQGIKKLRVVPPSNGIVHQINLEYFTDLISIDNDVIMTDSVIGTDSHTPMVNGVGILGWGVGGIEAESVMLGNPIYFKIPKVIGVELKGSLPETSNATDLALYITHFLRQEKEVVGNFVEFFGEGLDSLSVADRATISNMAPEYGAQLSYFPIDEKTYQYLIDTNRTEKIRLAKQYFDSQCLSYNPSTIPNYSIHLTLDLNNVSTVIAGPNRPEIKQSLNSLPEAFEKYCIDQQGIKEEDIQHHGKIALASITSCTNTSNPQLMIAAGLVAKKANELGLKVPSFTKTSFTPGSKVVTKYLASSGLLNELEKLGYYIDGYGCASCCGNSGNLQPQMMKEIEQDRLVAASILSGNRNFEARVQQLIKANFLASPPLVIAYSLAGTVQINLDEESIQVTPNGKPVYLKDIWPSKEDIQQIIDEFVAASLFEENYKTIFQNKRWEAIPSQQSIHFNWDEQSTYIQPSPFFSREKSQTLQGLMPLLVLGDSITTDHISPAGSIRLHSPAGQYLVEKGVDPKDFNSYGTRRGNHEVMVRGTFQNVRLKNKLISPKEGGFTKHIPSGETMSIYEASVKYAETDTPLCIFAGELYGNGSSRDWAAKGPLLLGVKTIFAKSFERIHRNNLIGVGILPLQFKHGEDYESLQLDRFTNFSVELPETLTPGQLITVRCSSDVETISFEVILRLDTQFEIDLYRKGGIFVGL